MRKPTTGPSLSTVRGKVIFMLLLALILLGVFFWYKSFLRPTVKLAQIQITSLAAEKTELTVNAVIENHIPISFRVDSLQYSIFVDSVEVIQEHYKKSVEVKGNDLTEVSLPVAIFPSRLFSTLKSRNAQGKDSVEYRFEISFLTDLFFDRKVVVSVNKFLPLLHPLQVEESHFTVSSLKFAEAEIDLLASVKNSNVFTVKVSNIAFELSIDGSELIKGLVPGITELRSQEVKELKIPIKLSLKEAGKTVFGVLTRGESVKYKLLLTFQSEMENKVMKHCKIMVESTGSVRSLLKIIKKKG